MQRRTAKATIQFSAGTVGTVQSATLERESSIWPTCPAASPGIGEHAIANNVCFPGVPKSHVNYWLAAGGKNMEVKPDQVSPPGRESQSLLTYGTEASAVAPQLAHSKTQQHCFKRPRRHFQNRATMTRTTAKSRRGHHDRSASKRRPTTMAGTPPRSSRS